MELIVNAGNYLQNMRPLDLFGYYIEYYKRSWIQSGAVHNMNETLIWIEEAGATKEKFLGI